MVGLLKKLSKKSNAKNIDTDMAPSVAEADAILAQFGYVEKETVEMVA